MVVVTPIFYTRQSRLREVKKVAQIHTVAGL